MMSDDEIFCAALDLDSEDKQRELVESLSARDSEQLKRVWGLLETHRQMQDPDDDSQSILDRPEAVFRAFSGVDELKPGKQVGKYVLGELIGQGATSLVFRARQFVPFEREVALKLLKPGMDSHRILARFGLEHQVIQRLEHPGVTTVYDAGIQDNGRPFFAMELVPNPLTIIQYAENFDLELSRRIQLMIATCEIVQHAHQRGVIHRDLKPSNILIEGIPQPHPKPRIIDFGIAKVMQPSQDHANFTTIGDRFGTPAYMSPEQALMPVNSVDIRSDVYSLGVILYELLTGKTPRKASSTSAFEPPWTNNAYWEYDVKLPSRVGILQDRLQKHRVQQKKRDQHSVRPAIGSLQELDWITIKAVAKDRQDRYQTVADLQRDLQRFLNGEPVEAAGLSLAYRVKKWINRNRTISLAAGITLLTIVTTSIITTSYAFSAREAKRQVQLQLQETLDTQRELLLERDRAEEAMRQSQLLLRVFQVQSVTHRSLARYMKQVFDVQRARLEGQATNVPAFQIDVEVLTKPHDRLIVPGDWTWATSGFPAEIINSSFQISSSEAARALPTALKPVPPDQNYQPLASQQATQEPPEQPLQHPADHPETQPAIKSRTAEQWQSFQNILLEELKIVLPSNDPFIAEVLDNCGLLALERNSPAEAEVFLTESIRIWKQSHAHPENLAQSQLFLAEAQSKLGRSDDADSMLNEASQSLDSISAEHAQLSALRQFHHQLHLDLRTVGSSKRTHLDDQPKP